LVPELLGADGRKDVRLGDRPVKEGRNG
jgi:hypothetical protein